MTDHWKGSTIDEIFGEFATFDNIKFEAPKIEDSNDQHTILFDLPLPDDENTCPGPKLIESDKWDDENVRLPHSKESIYYEMNENCDKIEKSRWELIKSSLKSQKFEDSHQLEKAIKAYNNKYDDKWNFKSLHKLFEDEFLEEESETFFNEVMPKIIDLALDLPNLIKSPIPLLKQKKNHSISLSKQQCACLLANAFLCTFPKRSVRRFNDLPEINFSRLFCSQGTQVIQKIKCICNYFRRVLMISMPTGVLTFQRRCINEFPKWDESELKFSSIKWHATSMGLIENAKGMLQMDFANRYLGGGVLGQGSVQEEIRFAVSCELIVGMLFCESMKPDEAIIIYGAEQFNKYSGYASKFKWEGNLNDDIPCDEFRRKLVALVAIDATSFHKPRMQFEDFLLKREVNKAFAGFYGNDQSDEMTKIAVATGNWGCGCFRGDKNLKSLIQFIACVATKRNLVYYTFGEENLVADINKMFTFLQSNDVTIGKLWKYLTLFKNFKKEFNELFQFIYDQYNAEKLLCGLESVSQEIKIDAEKRRSDEETTPLSSQDYELTEDENPSKRTKIDEEKESSSIKDLCEKLNEKIGNQESKSTSQKSILDFLTKKDE